jgi:hypothetical protein
MQFGQNTGPIPGRELDPFKFTTPVGPHAQVKLVRVVIAGDDRRGGLEIGSDVVGIGDGECGRVQGDYRDVGNA